MGKERKKRGGGRVLEQEIRVGRVGEREEENEGEECVNHRFLFNFPSINPFFFYSSPMQVTFSKPHPPRAFLEYAREGKEGNDVVDSFPS